MWEGCFVSSRLAHTGMRFRFQRDPVVSIGGRKPGREKQKGGKLASSEQNVELERILYGATFLQHNGRAYGYQ